MVLATPLTTVCKGLWECARRSGWKHTIRQTECTRPTLTYMTPVTQNVSIDSRVTVSFVLDWMHSGLEIIIIIFTFNRRTETGRNLVRDARCEVSEL